MKEAVNGMMEEIFDYSPLMMLVVDGDGRVVKANRKAAEVSSRTPEAIEGLLGGEAFRCVNAMKPGAVCGQQAACSLCDLRNAAMDTIRARKSVYATDGKLVVLMDDEPVELNLLIHTRLVESEEKPMAMVAVEDVTERTLARKALVESKEKAEVAVLAKDRFLANMSHEIRTPLNAIIGMTDILLKNKLGSKEEGIARKIKTSSSSLLEILNDILDYSKIEANKLDLYQTPFKITTLLELMRDTFTLNAHSKGLVLDFHYDSRLPHELIGDPFRLKQVLSNLLSNAVKFTEEGKIELSVSCDSLDTTTNSIILHFSVKDTGIGIPKEQISTIFDPFVQVDLNITRNVGGTGLGLSISQRLVQLMGGEITVDSGRGKGSCFRFSLPYKINHVTSEVDSGKLGFSGDAPDLSGRRILVAEDNEMNREVILGFLEETNSKVEFAVNGKKAVDAVKSQDFDLVLMDVHMPVLSGWEAAKSIRSWEQLEGREPIPIVALTARAFDQDKNRSREAGMDYHLSKPINMEEFYATLSILLG